MLGSPLHRILAEIKLLLRHLSSSCASYLCMTVLKLLDTSSFLWLNKAGWLVLLKWLNTCAIVSFIFMFLSIKWQTFFIKHKIIDTHYLLCRIIYSSFRMVQSQIWIWSYQKRSGFLSISAIMQRQVSTTSRSLWSFLGAVVIITFFRKSGLL